MVIATFAAGAFAEVKKFLLDMKPGYGKAQLVFQDARAAFENADKTLRFTFPAHGTNKGANLSITITAAVGKDAGTERSWTISSVKVNEWLDSVDPFTTQTSLSKNGTTFTLA